MICLPTSACIIPGLIFGIAGDSMAGRYDIEEISSRKKRSLLYKRMIASVWLQRLHPVIYQISSAFKAVNVAFGTLPFTTATAGETWLLFLQDAYQKSSQKFRKKAVQLVSTRWPFWLPTCSGTDYYFPVGINLVKADDFSTWWFTIEVMGDSPYKVSPIPESFTRCSLECSNMLPGREIYTSISL